MTGKEFAEKCHGVAKMLNELADSAKDAGPDGPEWAPTSGLPCLGWLLELACDMTKMKQD